MRLLLPPVVFMLALVACQMDGESTHLEPLCPSADRGDGGDACNAMEDPMCDRSAGAQRRLGALEGRMLEPELLVPGPSGAFALVHALDGALDGFVVARWCRAETYSTDYMQRDREGGWSVTASAGWIRAYVAAAGRFVQDKEMVLLGEFGKNQLVLGRPEDLADSSRFHIVQLEGQPYEVHAADLDGDGLADAVAVIGIHQEGGGHASHLVTWRGMGDGTLGEPVSMLLGNGNWGVTLGDINGDGRLDAVATNYGQSPEVGILLGIGAGRFQRANTLMLTTPSGPGGAPLNAVGTVLRDLNGDSHLDLIVGGASETVGMVVFEGDGTGAFRRPHEVAVPSYGDLHVREEGGRLQFITRSFPSNRMAVVEDLLAATPRVVEFHPGSSSVDGMVADIDGDGLSDMLVAGHAPGVRYLRGSGRYFEGFRTFPLAGGAARGVVLENSETLQLAIAASARNAILIGTLGDEGFAIDQKIQDAVAPFAIAAIDLNQDGLQDLVVGSIEPDVSVYLRREDGSFDRSQILAGQAWDFVVGDFDGDRHDDLVMSLADEGEIAFVYSSPGEEAWHVDRMPIGGDPGWLAIHDFDGDGDDDLLVALFRGGRHVRVENQGENGLGRPETLATLPTPQGIVVCDLDGDGTEEIVVGSFDGRSIQVVGVDGSVSEFPVSGRVSSVARIAAESGCGVIAIDMHDQIHSLEWDTEAGGPRLETWPFVLGNGVSPSSQIITTSRSIVTFFPASSRIGYLPNTPSD